MDATEKYFNFIRNYNEKLKEKGADWLGPTDMGDVLMQSAQQNMRKELASSRLLGPQKEGRNP